MNTAAVVACGVILLIVLAAPAGRTGWRNRTVRSIVRSQHPCLSPKSRMPAWRGVAESIARHRRSSMQPTQALATMLDDIARGCSSGASLAASFLATAADGRAGCGFVSSIRALRSGATLEEALGCEHSTHPDIALATHVLRVCALQGGNVSEALDRAASTLRERVAARNERIAQAAQARLSARVLTIVPIAFASWTIATTASVQRFMVTPIGLVCLVSGVGLNLAGWWLMNRTIKGA